MNAMIAWFARNHIAANMLMFLCLILGGFAIWLMPKEIIPDISLDTIIVSAAYPGASPRDVEEAVCIRIENAVAGLSGIGKMIGMPVLIVHGSSDRYVPPELSRRLFDAAAGRKKFLLIEGGSHNNSMRTGTDDYRKAFTEVFDWKPSS